jgi:two-component system LytT family response regulator
MSTKNLRVVIADDEPLARQRIEDMLAHEPGIEIVATAEDGDSAIEAIQTQRPDLVFLDVQMPGKTGVEVVREIGPAEMPATIFVTAYDKHALEAFELAALDYLVKPFDDERFEQALARARRLIGLEQVNELRSKLLAVLQTDEVEEKAPREPRYLERISVESRGKVTFVAVSDIEYITASGPYVEIHAGGKTHLIRESIQALEDKLDPSEFLRIHRSIIVRFPLAIALHKGGGGDYEVELKGGQRLKVSRGRRETVERRLAGFSPETPDPRPR